jgi:malate dehydrogenase (oxaloacetate-decarboxylating)(NADP+)
MLSNTRDAATWLRSSRTEPAKKDVPDSVCRAYGVERLSFGREYLIPTLFDPRVLVWEASAVAEAAMRTGVAQEPVDLATYREQLGRRLGKAYEVRAP